MALTDNDLWGATYSFRDKDGNVATTQSFLGGGAAYAVASASIAATAGFLGALSDAELVGITISRKFTDQNLLTNSAGPSSDVERKGAFVFVDSQNKPTTITVPSLKYGLTIPDTNVINLTLPDVLNLTGDIAAFGRTFRNLDIIRLLYAEKRHINSRKG